MVHSTVRYARDLTQNEREIAERFEDLISSNGVRIFCNTAPFEWRRCDKSSNYISLFNVREIGDVAVLTEPLLWLSNCTIEDFAEKLEYASVWDVPPREKELREQLEDKEGA